MRSTDELIENLHNLLEATQARLALTEAALSAAGEYIECIESVFVPDAWIRPSVHGEYTSARETLNGDEAK